MGQSTVCKGAALHEEPAQKNALSPWVMERLADRHLVRATCEPDLRLTYDSDDGSLYGLMVRQLTREQVVQWLDALENAGLDSVSISAARDFVKNYKDEGKYVALPGGQIKTAEGKRWFAIDAYKDVWALEGEIER